MTRRPPRSTLFPYTTLSRSDQERAPFGQACHRHAQRRRLNPFGHRGQTFREGDCGSGLSHGPLVAQVFSRRLELAAGESVERLEKEATLDEARACEPQRISASQMGQLVRQHAWLLLGAGIRERQL